MVRRGVSTQIKRKVRRHGATIVRADETAKFAGADNHASYPSKGETPKFASCMQLSEDHGYPPFFKNLLAHRAAKMGEK